MAKKSGTVTIDFRKEEEGAGGRYKWPEGDYHVQITKAKSIRSSDKDTPGIEVTFKVLEGKKKGKTFKENLWLTPKSLKRVRMLLMRTKRTMMTKKMKMKTRKMKTMRKRTKKKRK
jgi:hypothetical protein